jgi:DNA-binding cell septation regulator SpoVG
VIRDLRFTPAPRRLQRRGLVGWLSFGISPEWVVDGVTLRQTRDGRIVLSYPRRRDRRGRSHPLLRPVDDAARRELERAVLDELGLGGAS